MIKPEFLNFDTLSLHAGHQPDPVTHSRAVPIYQTTSYLFEDTDQVQKAFKDAYGKSDDAIGVFKKVPFYGRKGTPTSWSLETALTELEGGFDTVLTSSGLGAVTTALLSFLKTGDHLLMSDSVYEPTRVFCDTILRKYGVETTYYDPIVGDKIIQLVRSSTKVVFLESPGSHTFEIQDVPAICKRCIG